MNKEINSQDNNIHEEFNNKFHKFITEKYTIKDVLKDLEKNIKGAKNIRFRPVDWQGKSVVYVSGFSTEKEENVDPCLYRRVFLDCRDDRLSKIDALSGLEARKAFMDTEEERLDKDLKIKLKRDYDLNIILKKSFERLNSDKEKYKEKKKIWNTFYENIKNNFDIEKYMHEPPWKNEEKWPWRSMSKEELLKSKKDFLDQIEKTCKYYSDLEEQWENYYSGLKKIWEKYLNYYNIEIPDLICDPNSVTEEIIPEFAVPVKASDKFLGILSYYRGDNFSEDKAVNELNKLYSSILAVVCLRNRSELLKDVQKVTEAMAGESNLEKIATRIAEGIRKSFIGFKDTDVFPILHVCKWPIVKTDNLQNFLEYFKDSYQKREEPKSSFSWNDIPGNDTKRLMEFLIKKFSIDWVKTAKIEKIDDGKTIRLSYGKKYLSLSLNNEKTEVNLKIDDGRTDKFIVKIEPDKLNIYTYDDKKDHDLWEVEEELGHIPIRENGLGRKAITRWQDEAKKPKFPQAKNYFTISPDVDNPDSITGNIQALNKDIKTTGCLPLVFNQRIYGLLYLHCKKRHFFTETELEALETFGSQAAIAIENYNLVGFSYEQLYGTALLDRLANIKEDDVGIKLQKWATQIRNARAGDITKITKVAIKDLANHYKLPNTFVMGIGEREMHEVALQSIADYRDHFIHTFHVFCLGYCIIDEWKERNVNRLGINLKAWFITSIYHDFGVPLAKLEKLFEKIAGHKIKSQIDWNPILLANGKDKNGKDKTNKNINHIDKLSNIFASKSRKSNIIFSKWFYKQLLENHDHGVFGALMLFDHDWKTHKYLFSWDEIPGNDNKELIEYLTQNFCVDWVKTAKIDKVDDDRTIKVFNEKNYLSLRFNNERTKINLEIDDGRTDELVLEEEDGRLNVYIDETDVILQSALAISLHQYRRDESKTDFNIGQIKVEDFPLAFLLSFCDLAQEWGRNILLDKSEKLDYQALKNLNHKLENPVDLSIEKDKIHTDVRIKYASDQFTIIGDMTLQERLNKIADEFGSTWYLEDRKIEFCIVCLDPFDHYIKNIYPGRQNTDLAKK